MLYLWERPTDDSAGFLLCHGKGFQGVLAKSLEEKTYIAKDVYI